MAAPTPGLGAGLPRAFARLASLSREAVGVDCLSHSEPAVPRLPVSVTRRADPVFRRHSHGMLNSWNLRPIGTPTFVGKPKADAGMHTLRQPRCIPVIAACSSLIRPNCFPDMPELFPCYAPVIFLLRRAGLSVNRGKQRRFSPSGSPRPRLFPVLSLLLSSPTC